MRLYPIFNSAGLYTEVLNEWNKYILCSDVFESIKRKDELQKNLTIYYPEKKKSSKKKSKKKKKRKKRGKKKKNFIRVKASVAPQSKVQRYWNDIEGRKIDSIKLEHINWSDWKYNRSYNRRFLPYHFRRPRFGVLRGNPQKPNEVFSLIPISLADVREIKKNDKIAKKLAKKLAKAKKKEEKLAKKLAEIKRKLRGE